MQVEINFSVTEEAIAELKKALSDSEPVVRVSAVSSGCSGTSYGLGIIGEDEIDTSADVVEDISGVKFVADKGSAVQLDGVVLGWHSGPAGEGFKFSSSKPQSCCKKGGCCS